MNELFLKKVSPTFMDKFYLIPRPTLSPEERERRRLAYRNERNLYRRKSSLSGVSIISMFHKDSPYKIYSHEEWWADTWDALDYGREFDFGHGFFEQFQELQCDVPRPPLVNNKAENSDYCNFSDANKNSYLITSANYNEDCYYSFLMVNNRGCSDCLWCSGCELVYEGKDCRNCYNIRYSENCENCRDGGFLVNCQGLENCFFCVNLRNKKYHLFNEPCSKDIYDNMVSYLSGSHKNYLEALINFEKLKKKFPIRESSNFVSSENVSGNNIYNCRNVTRSFDIFDSEDISFSHDGLTSKDCADVCYFGEAELCYESTSLIGYGYRFTSYCRDSYNLFYCDNCHACKNCFGCCGLRNKEYCIFNKQYSKEKYEALAAKIIGKMIETKEWGEFFPIENSPFAYNETLANDFFPLRKDEVLSHGWKWRNENKQNHKENFFEQIGDNIDQTEISICDHIFKCEVSGSPFKIIPQEYRFYKRMNLPLPRKSPETRHLERITSRLPRKLWDRECSKCDMQIKTAYSPSSPETIYCSKCYMKHIY